VHGADKGAEREEEEKEEKVAYRWVEVVLGKWRSVHRTQGSRGQGKV